MKPFGEPGGSEPAGREPACARTDAVLAVYLDGDIGADSGFELVCGEALEAHLRGCAECGLQLARARRLDALLAAGAGTASGEIDALAARWALAVEHEGALAGTAGAPSDREHADRGPGREPSQAPDRRRARLRSRALAAVAAGIAVLGAIGWAFARSTDAAAAPPAAPPEPAVQVEPPSADRPSPIAPAPAETEPASTGGILIAGDAARRRAQRPPVEAAPTRSAADAWRRLGDRELSAAQRLLAVEDLAAERRNLLGSDAAEFAAAADVLAGLGDRGVASTALHDRCLALVRADARATAQLAAHLQRLAAPRVQRETNRENDRTEPDRTDLAAVTVAARLGTGELDELLLRAVRRRPELAATVAAALRCGARRSGSARLMLDVWQDLEARDAAGAERGLAWFAAQPPRVFEELLAELRAARSSPRRVHCLLGLGEGSGEDELAALLEHVERAPFLEAHAAAYALSRRPRHELEALAQQTQHGFLLRAAFARAGLPVAEPWIAALALDPAGLASLRRGPFADFPAVASWFRDRAIAAQ